MKITFLIPCHQTDREDILCVGVCDMLGLYLSFSAVVYYCIIYNGPNSILN